MTISDATVEQIESSREILKEERRRRKEGRKRKEENGRMRDNEIEERGGGDVGKERGEEISYINNLLSLNQNQTHAKWINFKRFLSIKTVVVRAKVTK